MGGAGAEDVPWTRWPGSAQQPDRPVPAPWIGPAGPVAGALFGALTKARGARVFHPDGSGYRAEVSITPAGRPTGAPFLDRQGLFEAAVRFSRGAGTPDPVPDVLGLAIKVFDAHGPGRDQDFLLVSSVALPGARHLLVPATGFLGRPFSSVLPYLVGRRIRLFGAAPISGPWHDGGTALAEVHAAARSGELRFELRMAGELGAWHPIGELRVGDALDDAEADALRFNPWHTGRGITPLGILQALRRSAYLGSQRRRQRQ